MRVLIVECWSEHTPFRIAFLPFRDCRLSTPFTLVCISCAYNVVRNHALLFNFWAMAVVEAVFIVLAFANGFHMRSGHFFATCHGRLRVVTFAKANAT